MSPLRQADAAVLKALAHPLRLFLLEQLIDHGPATVGLLATRTDEAVGSVSHHVRRLADAGLVQTAPELARDRRERWWRAVPGAEQLLVLARDLRLSEPAAEEHA